MGNRNRNRNRNSNRNYYHEAHCHHGRGLGKGFSLLVIGCVLIGIGLSLGGRWTNIPWLPWFNGPSVHVENHPETIEAKSGTIADGIQTIDIRLKASSLVIKTGTAGSYSATGFNKNAIHISSNNNTLKIEENEWEHIIDFAKGSKQPVLEIVLPAGVALKSCRVSIGAGSAQFESVSSDDMDVESGAGSIRGSAINAKNIRVKTGAGSIELGDCILDETDITTGAGRFVFNGSLGKRTEISTGAGSVEMSVKGKKDDFRIDYSRGVGSVRINDDSFSGMGNGTAGNENADKKIRLSSGVGAVRIDFTE